MFEKANNIYIFILILAIILLGLVMFSYHVADRDAAVRPGQVYRPESAANSPQKDDIIPEPSELASTSKTFRITAENFAFSIAEISVKQGDSVKIILESREGLHDLKIDELNIATRKIEAGEFDAIQFVADKIGRFEYYCGIGSHRQLGMKGTLIVAP